MRDDIRVSALQEEVEKLKAEKEQRVQKEKQSFITKIPSGKRTLFLIGTGIICFIGYSHAWSWQKVGVIVGVMAIAVYLTSIEEEPVKKRVLSPRETMARVMEQFKNERMHPLGDLPMIPQNVKIKPEFVGNLQFRDGTPFVRMCGIKTIDPRTYMETVYQVDVEPFEGYILGVIERPEGITGEERRDLQPILSPELKEEKMYNKAMGGMKKRAL